MTLEPWLVLDEVLAGARPGAVIPSGDDAPADAARAAELADRAGWAVVALDTAGAADKEALLDRLQQGLGLPDWFGHNWDALADCLTDVRHPVGTLLVWTGWQDVAAGDPTAFGVALEVLGERAASVAGDRFAVLLATAPPPGGEEHPTGRG